MKNKTIGTFEENSSLVVDNRYFDIPASDDKFKDAPVYLILLLTLFIAICTWEGIYFGASITAQNSNVIMDEKCFLGFWLYYQNFTSDPKNFATKTEEKLLEHFFFETFAYHSKARNEHYLFDPMIVLGFFYFVLLLFVVFRWTFDCALKKNQQIFDILLNFTFFFFLTVILLYKTYFFCVFWQTSQKYCSNQFWNL